MKIIKHFCLCLILLSTNSFAQKGQNPAFQIVPLGVKGGIDETNLSAYLIGPTNKNAFVCMDAGTLHAGITKAVANGVFNVSADIVLKDYIKAYFISHAHLDHVSGLIINSPADAPKTVYATASTMKMMEDHYFNGVTWANFGDEGSGYQIKKYHFQKLLMNASTAIDNSSMTVQAFYLSHVNPFKSTAFLLRSGDSFVLYLGDTGADSIEKSIYLAELWSIITPLIQTKSLKGIFIETSFPNSQPDTALYGHLTPKLLFEELTNLSKKTGVKPLENFPIIITHLKPPTSAELTIKKELQEENTLGVRLIFPEQGVRFEL